MTASTFSFFYRLMREFTELVVAHHFAVAVLTKLVGRLAQEMLLIAAMGIVADNAVFGHDGTMHKPPALVLGVLVIVGLVALNAHFFLADHHKAMRIGALFLIVPASTQTMTSRTLLLLGHGMQLLMSLDVGVTSTRRT